MFVDVAKIYVKAGKGGNGIVSFRREKYIAAGGPDGGDGGKGADVIFRVDGSMSTLMDFRYKKRYNAKPGENGGPSDRTGRGAEDLVIKVPPGTVIKDINTGKVIADLTEDGQRFVVVKGGRGGRGNARFTTSTRQIPRFAEQGEEGEEREILLELKLLADVGLVGYPNVGKSTILSIMTSAKPKIADYHFTTLEPNLGVVMLDDGVSFVLADIPGLIEGAHEGVGLGHQFLRHVERTRVLVHVLDVSGVEGRNPIEDFEKINSELKQFNQKLATRKQIVAANKMDLPEAEENFKKLKDKLAAEGYEVFPICAAIGEGLKEVFYRVSELLKEIPVEEETIIEEELVYEVKDDGWNIRREGEIFVIEGEVMKRVLRKVNFDDTESLQYFQRAMNKLGISKELEKMGIEEGDTVQIYDIEFEYVR
ncbi:MAG: GTPase ObgE [Deltaproteobacteria bacterium]